MKLKIQKGIDQKTILRALDMIEQVNNKELKPKRLNITGNNCWCSISIGIRFRVLIKKYDENNKVLIASLLHHEKYNKEIRIK